MAPQRYQCWRAIFQTTPRQHSSTFSMFLSHPVVIHHCSEIIPSLKEKSYDLSTRFSERATAEVLLETLGRTLGVLGLSSQDVSGITTDAATVMVKLGGLLRSAVQRPAPSMRRNPSPLALRQPRSPRPSHSSTCCAWRTACIWPCWMPSN